MSIQDGAVLRSHAKIIKKATAQRAREAMQLVAAFAHFLDLPGRCDYDSALIMGVLMQGLGALDRDDTRDRARMAGAQILARYVDATGQDLPVSQPRLLMAILEREPTPELRQQLDELQFSPFATQSPLPHFVGWATAGTLKPVVEPFGGTVAPYRPPGAWLARAAIQTGSDRCAMEELDTLSGIEERSSGSLPRDLPSKAKEPSPTVGKDRVNDPESENTRPANDPYERPLRIELRDHASGSARRHNSGGGAAGVDTTVHPAPGGRPAPRQTQRKQTSLQRHCRPALRQEGSADDERQGRLCIAPAGLWGSGQAKGSPEAIHSPGSGQSECAPEPKGELELA